MRQYTLTKDGPLRVYRKQLTYWIAECFDAPQFSFRAKTKRECDAVRFARMQSGVSYGKPKRVVVEFTDAFDLLRQAKQDHRT